MKPGTALWKIAASSLAGTSHAANSVACQDAHDLRLIRSANGPVLVVAVADGAGSARAGAIGSSVAVAAIIEQAVAWVAGHARVSDLDRAVMTEWLSGAREAIAELAGAESVEMRDYASTLLVAVVGPDAAAFAQLGDGAIVVRTPEHEWSWIFWPQHGDYVNTTYFLTDDDALIRFAFEAVPRPVDEIAMFTDGLERLILDVRARATHDPFFRRMFPPLRSSATEGYSEELSRHLADYLRTPAVTSRTDDDVTLVLASRRPAEHPSQLTAISEPADAGHPETAAH